MRYVIGTILLPGLIYGCTTAATQNTSNDDPSDDDDSVGGQQNSGGVGGLEPKSDAGALNVGGTGGMAIFAQGGTGGIGGIGGNPSENIGGEGGTGYPPSDGSFYIYGTNPDNGFQGVSSSTAYVYFSKAYSGSTSKIHVSLEDNIAGNSIGLMFSTLDSEKKIASFSFGSSLEENKDYCLSVEVEPQSGVQGAWPVQHEGCFTTTMPCGVPINIGQDVIITQLGSDDSILKTLNFALSTATSDGNNFPLAMLIDGVKRSQTFPFSSDVAIGAFESSSNQIFPEGYTATFSSCSVESDGAFSCSSTGDTAFPLYFESTKFEFMLYISNTKFSSTIQSSGNIQNSTEMKVSGYVTQENLDRIFDQLYDNLAVLETQIVLDLDIDGDGTKDAASVEIKTTPTSMTLTGADCP